ncbi:MAG: NAD(+)/NADH kinase, partial [Lachnospiraceae bacterium]|nr:NAD(+)/NADH kinase [Lachnospiraceae bacterium]
MKHFLIATNCIKDEKLSLTSELENYILKNGGTAKRILGDNGGSVSYEVADGESFDGIIALGGDGTILKVSRDLRRLNIPIVGVNLGTMGFLTEIEPEQLFPVVDRLMKDDYELEKRMNICGEIFQNGKEEPELFDVALNDIVVSRA